MPACLRLARDRNSVGTSCPELRANDEPRCVVLDVVLSPRKLDHNSNSATQKPRARGIDVSASSNSRGHAPATGCGRSVMLNRRAGAAQKERPTTKRASRRDVKKLVSGIQSTFDVEAKTIDLQRKLSDGNFGTVWFAVLKRAGFPNMEVAVKQLKTKGEKEMEGLRCVCMWRRRRRRRRRVRGVTHPTAMVP